MEFRVIKNENQFNSKFTREEFVNFLLKHLGKSRNERKKVDEAITDTLSISGGRGGFLVAGFENGELVSEIVMNHVGKAGYLIKHMPVYVAIKSDEKEKFYGRKIIRKALDLA